MAEAWTRHLRLTGSSHIQRVSNPRESIPGQSRPWLKQGSTYPAKCPRILPALGNLEFDYVITLCDNAHEACPFFPAKTRVLHVGFDDPPRLAAGARTEEEAMAHYRRVRDEIKKFVESLPDSLKGAGHGE